MPYVGNSVVDGSHRLGAALDFRKPIDAVRLEGRPPITDAAALVKSGMGSVIAEQLVTEYVRLDEDTFSATFFAASPSDYRQAMKLLGEKAHVIHSKQIGLSEKGRRNINRLLYGHEPWWKDEHAERFVDRRFPQRRRNQRSVLQGRCRGGTASRQRPRSKGVQGHPLGSCE